MDDSRFEPLARLTTLGDLTSARLAAARLESEGFHVVVRGEPMGPYPVTVGSMAVTEILVPERELDEARVVLVEMERDTEVFGFERAGQGVSPSIGVSALWWLVAAGLLALIIWARIGRYL